MGDIDTALQCPPVASTREPKKETKASAPPQNADCDASPQKKDAQKCEDVSHKKLSKAVEKLLQGKALEQITFGPFRKDIENDLGLEDGALDERKDELKDVIAKAIQKL